MIKNVGLSRVIIVGFLLALNVLLGAGAYFYLAPMAQKKEVELRSAKGLVQSRYSEIMTLREDFALLEDRLTEFSELELSGFFDNQNKVFADSKGKEFAVKSNVTGTFTVKAAEEVVDSRAEEAGHVLLKSPVEVILGGEDDVDVMYFIKLMQKQFPGIVEFEHIELKRVQDIDASVLRQIGSGGSAKLVEADIMMNWITMPNKEELK